MILSCLASLLAGCQSDMGGAWQTLHTALWGADPPSGERLDPRFRYLRVTAGKQVAFLALGYVDPDPQGPIEIWYSADREVLRLQNGRLVGAAGTRTEWRQVRMPVLPAWRELATADRPHGWRRIRDVMPGYQFNLADHLQVGRIAPPAQSRLLGVAPANYTWFEEKLAPQPAAHGASGNLPPARYAVEFSGDAERVVYAEQCLSTDLCLTWQRWVAGQ